MIKYLLLVLLTITSKQIVYADLKSSTEHAATANHLARKGNHQEALNSLNVAIAEDPQNAHAYKLRSHVQYAIGNYREALADMNAFVALVPEAAIGYTDRSIIHAKTGNQAQANADIKRAQEIKPDSVYILSVQKQIEDNSSG